MKSILTGLLIVLSTFSFANEQTTDGFDLNVEKRKDLVQKIDDLKEEIEILENKALTRDQILNYEDEISYMESRNSYMQKEIEDARNKKTRGRYVPDTAFFKVEINYNKEDIQTIRNLLDVNIKNEEGIRNKTDQLEEAEFELQELEVQISLDLYKKDYENRFKSVLSWIFCGLVLIVIVGFFWLTYRKEEIARNIFSGDHGIQFITLFLLIISIILFGIMGVLQGRELGALIGGISGYILGRSGGSIINGVKKATDGDDTNGESESEENAMNNPNGDSAESDVPAMS